MFNRARNNFPEDLEVHRVALQCREDLLSDTVGNEELARLYELYLPTQLFGLSYYLQDRPAFPDQNCQPASVYLRHKIGRGDIDDGLYISRNGLRMPHSFLDLGKTLIANTTIVDITADQFGGPKVYTGPLVEPWVSAR